MVRTDERFLQISARRGRNWRGWIFAQRFYQYVPNLALLDKYLSLEIPLVLHYTARPASAESFKTAAPIAFQIPMTTDFALVADWFIEHENSENAKRLRVDNAYRSPELELIRYVLKEGLNLLNAGKDAKFSDLRTEMDETVSDGQVRSWLSINKNGLDLHKTEQLGSKSHPR